MSDDGSAGIRAVERHKAEMEAAGTPEAILRYLRHAHRRFWARQEQPDLEKWVKAMFEPTLQEMTIEDVIKDVIKKSGTVPINVKTIIDGARFLDSYRQRMIKHLTNMAWMHDQRLKAGAILKPNFHERSRRLPREECTDRGDYPITTTKISASLTDRRKWIAGRWITLPPNGRDPYPRKRQKRANPFRKDDR